MMAAPAAESYAIKDAVEKLGKLFGKDLNRKDSMGYDMLGNKFDMASPEQMNAIEMMRQHCAFDDNQIADMDAELFEGITEIRANEIIGMLDMNKLEPSDPNRVKDINQMLDKHDKRED